jgi:hypothetical protein
MTGKEISDECSSVTGRHVFHVDEDQRMIDSRGLRIFQSESGLPTCHCGRYRLGKINHPVTPNPE